MYRPIVGKQIYLRREEVSFVNARVNFQCCKNTEKRDFPKKCNFAFVNSLFYKYDKTCFSLVWVKTYVLSLYVTVSCISFYLTSQLELHNETDHNLLLAVNLQFYLEFCYNVILIIN